MRFLAKNRFTSIVFLLLLVVLAFAAEPVSAASAASKSPATHKADSEWVGNAQTTIIVVDNSVYLPMVTRRWPPIPPAFVLSASVTDFYTVTLSWSTTITDISVSSFTVQEAEAADFSDATFYTLTEQTLSLSNKPFGTYYYRVRGHNSWGIGVWSNVEAIDLHTFIDDFEDHTTGWRVRRTSSPDPTLMQVYYIDGELETFVRDKFDFAIFSSMLPAPKLPYTIKFRTKVRHRVNEVSYGVAFGGNLGTFCDVKRKTSMSPDGCFSHYYRLNVIWAGNYLKFNVNRVDGHDDRGRGISEELMGFYNLSGLGHDPADWHDWEIRVTETGFSIYVNDRYISKISDTLYLNEPYYGIFSSTYEYNNAHFEHEYFYIFPEDQGLFVPTPKMGGYQPQ